MSKNFLQEEDFFLRLEKSQTAAIERAAEAAAMRVLLKTGAVAETIDFAEVKKNYPHSIARRALQAPEIEWKRKGTGSKTCGWYCNRNQFLNHLNATTK